MYKIIDRQIAGREFADGALFATPSDIREQLIDYHSIDCEDIEQLKRMTLNELLDYGEWAIEEVHNTADKQLEFDFTNQANALHRAEGSSNMIVKIAPLGERIVEVNVEEGVTVGSALSVAGVLVNERSIAVNNVPADEDTLLENSIAGTIITLAQKMKGGK